MLPGNPRKPKFQQIAWDPVQAEKGGYKHFMLKEIIEQPTAVANTVLGRLSQDTNSVHLDEVGFTDAQWKSFKQIRILACGTSWHAALVGKHMIESLARVPVEVDYASEFRYRNPIILPDSLFIFITQSGETADTIAAQRLVRESGSKILTITNVVGSMTTRIADGVCTRARVRRSAWLRRRHLPRSWCVCIWWRFIWESCTARLPMRRCAGCWRT